MEPIQDPIFIQDNVGIHSQFYFLRLITHEYNFIGQGVGKTSCREVLQMTDIFQKPLLPTSDLSSVVRGFQKFDEWMPEEEVVNLCLEENIG